jgi:hypothetical protein
MLVPRVADSRVTAKRCSGTRWRHDPPVIERAFGVPDRSLRIAPGPARGERSGARVLSQVAPSDGNLNRRYGRSALPRGILFAVGKAANGNADRLAREVAATWPLTHVSVNRVVRIFGTRTVAVLAAAEGTFVIKIDGRPRLNADASVNFDVLGYLEASRFPHAPRAVRTVSGALGARIHAGVAYVMEYVPNKPRSTPLQWRDFGAAVAGLNAHGGYHRPFAIPIRVAIDELAERAAGRSFGSEMRALLYELTWLSDLPADALVHGEVNCANAGVRTDGTTVLLDWDQAGTAPAALDYGYPLLTQFIAESSHRVDLEAARAFYRSYRDNGGTVDVDQCVAASVFHALRYMWCGDTEARWRRIQFARDHRSALIAAVLA